MIDFPYHVMQKHIAIYSNHRYNCNKHAKSGVIMLSLYSFPMNWASIPVH